MTKEKTNTPHIWKKLMLRYGILMVTGIVSFFSIIPLLKEGAQTWHMVVLLLSGLAGFGGLFGLIVALFFYVWHNNKAD